MTAPNPEARLRELTARPPLDVEAQPREHAGRLVWSYRVPRRDA